MSLEKVRFALKAIRLAKNNSNLFMRHAKDRKWLLAITFLIVSLSSCAQNTAEKNILPGAYSISEYLPLLEGKNVALVVNQTSELRSVHLVDTLQSLGIKTTVIFAPEHGFRGTEDAGKAIKDQVDEKTNIPIYSLYGANKKPSKEQLKGIEIVVFDIQDVGARFYTYLSTLHYVMESCAELNIPVIVLDRPNPNIHYVDGPVMEKEHMSFVGLHPVPIVYGMTIGEYAKMINGEKWLANGVMCDLKVIKVQNYTRKSRFDLPIKPSPNLPTANSISWYPSLCLFEGTVVSAGRGTMMPFEVVGHPKYNKKDFSYSPIAIKGMSSFPKFKNQQVYGIDLRQKSQVKTQLDLGPLLEMYTDLNLGDGFFNNFFENLAGTGELRKAIQAGLTEVEIRALWQEDLEEFKKVRVKYLVYPN